jgi:hypothetical protein
LLTAAEFHLLADVPPEVDWFANITNPHTRRAYECDFENYLAAVFERYLAYRPLLPSGQLGVTTRSVQNRTLS